MEEEPPIVEPAAPKQQPIYIKVLVIIVKLLGYALALVIATGLLSFVMASLAPNLNPEDLQEGDISDWRTMSILYIGVLAGTFLVTYFFRVGIDRQAFATVGLQAQNIGINLWKGAVYATALLSISFLILWLIGAVTITDLQFEPLELAGFLLLFLLAALVEELIFRGYIIPLIAKDFHFMSALLFSSLVFAWVHIGNAHFTWISFWNIFFGGYLLAIIFYKNQELYTPLGLHWIWNYFQGNILGFGVSGYEVESFLTIEQKGTDWLTGGEFGLEGSIITTTLLFLVCTWLTYKWYYSLQYSVHPLYSNK